jgi:hypothetical protein
MGNVADPVKRWVGGGLLRRVDLEPGETVRAEFSAMSVGAGRLYLTDKRIILVHYRGWIGQTPIVPLDSIEELSFRKGRWFGDNLEIRYGRLDWLNTTAGPFWYLTLILLAVVLHRFDQTRELYDAIQAARTEAVIVSR